MHGFIAQLVESAPEESGRCSARCARRSLRQQTRTTRVESGRKKLLASGPEHPVTHGEAFRAQEPAVKRGPQVSEIGERACAGVDSNLGRATGKGEVGRNGCVRPNIRVCSFFLLYFYFLFSIFKSNLNSSLNSNFYE